MSRLPTRRHTASRASPIGPRFRLGKNRRVVRAPTAERRAHVWRSVRWLFTALVVTVGVGGAVAGAYYGWDALVHSQRLVVRRIDIAGAQRVARQELVAYAGLDVGQPILDLDLDGMALKLRRHPWVASATVRRRLPDAVHVEVTEYEPAMVVALGDLYLADASGHVFNRLRAADDVTLPVLTGLSRADVARDPEALAHSIREALHIASALAGEYSLLGRLEELRRDADLGWLAVVVDDTGRPMTVHLGERAEAALQGVRQVLAQMAAQGVRPEVVWADRLEGATTLQVRLARGDAAARGTTLIAQAR